MEKQLLDGDMYSPQVLNFCRVAHTYHLANLARFHKTQGSIMCKVDLKVLPYVKVLSETHPYAPGHDNS